MHRLANTSVLLTVLAFAAPASAAALAPQQAPIPEGFTRADQLRGSIGPERSWWDLQHYDLSVQVFPEKKSLAGSNIISFRTVAAGKRMQIDLQPPLAITRVTHGETELSFEREGKVYWIQFPEELAAGVEDQIRIDYEGVPVESKNPPLHGADEPDRGVDIRVTVPKGLTAVANGRLIEETKDKKAKTSTFHWKVTKPISNYCVNVNIGNYVSWADTYKGEHGKLDLEYWVLKGQEKQAKEQFQQLPMTIEAFEHWFGKYPFYEDSFKLVVVPYLGMEHQSSVTYGNEFKNGYRGRDLSDTGVG